MFKLLKITNSGANVPEPERLSLSTQSTVSRGAPAYLKDGKMIALNSASETLPTHIAVRAISGKNALCYHVTPDMVFETQVAADPTNMVVGSEYLLSSDGSFVSATKVSGTVRGATLLSKNGATKLGDKIIVAFR